jgi:DNA-binding CsgD family transcriptional regulator
MLSSGMKSKGIARELKMNSATVDSHIKDMKGKLRVSSRKDLRQSMLQDYHLLLEIMGRDE